jgi:O-acetylserine/cysteine efflux transporter
MTLKDTLLGFFIIFIWGVNFVVIVWGLEGLPPLLMGGLRFLLVASLGCLFVKRPDIPLHWLTFYALTLCFGQFALLFSAMAFGMPAGLASLVLQSQALFTMIFSVLILKEKLKNVQLLSMFVAGIGLYIIGSSESGSAVAHSVTANTIVDSTVMTGIGFGLTIASAVSWGFGNVINRMISERGYKADISLVVWSAWIPPIPFLLMSFWFEGAETIYQSIINISLQSIAALFYLAIFASMVGYSLWSRLLSTYPAGQVAPLTLGVPVVGLAAAALLLGERISELQMLGIIVVLAGLLINTFGHRVITLVRVLSSR